MSNIDLLPRADIPVLFNDFKTKADAVWSVVDSLVVTDISQKEAMALARKTRLDLRNIRVAVEHKRVELGENHLKEIQKVNGAAKAIREFIEPLEARLLVQESFAERAEATRIAALSKLRFDEVEAIKPRAVWVPQALAEMPQKEYDDLVARLRSEKAEIEEANRLRIEAERKLAEAQAEALAVAEVTRKTLELTQRVALEEKQRRDAEAERIQTEQEIKRAAELSAASALRTLEREAAEKRRQEDLRIEREKTAALEAELAAERAVKLAETEAARKLALAPDVEKLRAYRQAVKDLPVPQHLAPNAERCFTEAVYTLAQGLRIIDQFCERNTI